MLEEGYSGFSLVKNFIYKVSMDIDNTKIYSFKCGDGICEDNLNETMENCAIDC